MAENVLGGLLGYSNALKRRIRGLLNDPVNFLESALYDVIPRPEESAAVDPRNLSATPFDSPYVQKTLQMGGLLGPIVGRPVKLYHATKDAFSPEQYDVQRAASSSGHTSAEFPAMWTTRSPRVANIFAHKNVADAYPLKLYGPQGAGTHAIRFSQPIEGANIVPLKGVLKNPAIIRGADAERMAFGKPGADWRESGSEFAEFLRRAKDAGHDGVIIKANPRGALEFRAEQYVFFDPKSAVRSVFDRQGVNALKGLLAAQ